MDTTTASETQWIALDSVDLPADARQHSDMELDALAKDMTTNGQLQEIVVVKQADRYLVCAGVGRYQAARKLHWERIRALVREGLSPFEQLHIMYSENEQREDASPLYQAGLLRKMMQLNSWNQEQLAESIGKSKATVSLYLGLAELPTEIAEKFRRLNLSMGHLTQLLRVKDTDQQASLADECVQKDLSVRDLKNRIDHLLQHTKSLPAKRPLDEITRKGDSFYINRPFEPKKENLASYLSWLVEALKAIEVAAPKIDSAPAVEDQTPTSTGLETARLPQTPEEQAELERSATPSAFYRWIYGTDSPLALGMEGKTWSELAVTDPPSRIRSMLEIVRKRKDRLSH